MKINYKFNVEEKVVNIYLAFLIFNLVNKDFLPFKIDIRYIVLMCGMLLLIRRLTVNNFSQKLKNKNIFYLTVFLYILFFCSNIFWFLQPVADINIPIFINLIVLYIYNFVNISVIFLYEEYIEPYYITKCFVFACFVLFISIVWVYFGYELIFIDKFNNGIYEGENFQNAFGSNYRLSGYGVDPNYVTLWMVVLIVLVMKYNKNFIVKALLVIMAIITILLSFSKTIILCCVPVILFAFIISKCKRKKYINL